MAKQQIFGLVLAAGLSQRMGTPKQLLPFGNRTILQAVIDNLLAADLAGVWVVLGHGADAVQQSLGDRPVTCCINPHYKDGMFSSLLCGLQQLPPTADAVLIALGDQPHIHTHVAQTVIDAYRKGSKGIVIPSVNDKRGHPVIVDLHRYRDEIFALSGAEGLKPVMRGHPDDTHIVPVTDAGILRDLDTPEQYRAELERQKKA